MFINIANTTVGMGIVKHLGYIEAKPSVLCWDTRKSARKNLEKKAEELGANAIINYKIQSLGLFGGAFAAGNAVILLKKI